MIYSYDRLWKILIDRKMTKTEMRIQAGISTNMLAKMGKEKPVTMETIAKICSVLNCRFDDIVEISNDDNKKTANVLSLFSGCGGMDIGFEGGFNCFRRSINTNIHPDWIEEDGGIWVKVKKTMFNTVFANDIRPDAKAAWTSYFSSRINNAEKIYHVNSIVDLVKREKKVKKFFLKILIL